MNAETKKELDNWNINKTDIVTKVNCMISEGNHYWLFGEEINNAILNCAYFDNSRDINQYYELAKKYNDYYDINKDPWTIKGDRPILFDIRRKFVYELLNGRIDYITIRKHYEWVKEYGNRKLQKTDLSDLECDLFILYFLSECNHLATDIISIDNRQLTEAFISLENVVNQDNLKQFRTAFNKNRKNILYNSMGGYYQVLYYYQKMKIFPSPNQIREAQLIGIL